MGRWEPDAAGRLRIAALDLFGTVGYEETTVAQIAERAGVTARTFFRYFADKPEVLFDGSEHMEHAMVEAVANAPAKASPRQALDAGLEAAVELLAERADFAQRRSAVIRDNATLLERETMKMARIAEAMAGALRGRGVSEPQASMTAQAGVAAFRIAFASWVEKPSTSLAETIADNLAVLDTIKS